MAINALRNRLGEKNLPRYTALLAVLLALPSLWVGWQIDDFFHRAMLVGMPEIGLPQKPANELFAFVDGNPEHIHAAMDSGVLPWWTYEKLHLEFWRPLSSLTHWLDYRLWPESPLLMHVHNLVWFAALVFLAATLYRRLIGPIWVAGLAALLFAVEDNHSLPAAWIANRNALLSSFFALLALYLHDRWRRDRWKPGIVLAPLTFAAALLCGEAAAGVAGYLFAHVLYLDSRRDRRRWAALLPYVAVGIVWLAAYRAQGYGASGSEPYNDPGSDPVGFIGLVLQRFPLSLMGQFGLPPADIASLASLDLQRVLLVWAPILLAFLAYVFWPLLRSDRTARFFAVGMLIAVLPLCSVYPMDRVLTLVGFGAIGLIGMFLAGVYEKAAWLPASRLRRKATVLAALVLFFIHGVISTLQLPVNTYMPAVFGNTIKDAIATIPADADLTDKSLVVVNMPDAFISSYIPILRVLNGQPIPERTYALAPAGQSVVMERVDERTIRLKSAIGFLPPPGTQVDPSAPRSVSFAFIHQRLNALFRGPQNPLKTGDHVRLTGLDIEIAAADAVRGPTEVVFHFAVPLEDPSLYWIEYVSPPEGAARYVHFTPPSVGTTVEVR